MGNKRSRKKQPNKIRKTRASWEHFSFFQNYLLAFYSFRIISESIELDLQLIILSSFWLHLAFALGAPLQSNPFSSSIEAIHASSSAKRSTMIIFHEKLLFLFGRSVFLPLQCSSFARLYQNAVIVSCSIIASPLWRFGRILCRSNFNPFRWWSPLDRAAIATNVNELNEWMRNESAHHSTVCNSNDDISINDTLGTNTKHTSPPLSEKWSKNGEKFRKGMPCCMGNLEWSDSGWWIGDDDTSEIIQLCKVIR